MNLRFLGAAAAFFAMALFSSAQPLAVGATAPAVSGVTETGATLNLGDLYPKQTYTLVYFFPKAETPGCTAQGCSLRDAYAELQDKGVAVVGVSADTVKEQLKFKEKYHFPFTLIADHDHAVMKAFGVPTMPVTGWAKRQAFLIKDGKIVWADYRASTSKQAEDVLSVIAGQEN